MNTCKESRKTCKTKTGCVPWPTSIPLRRPTSWPISITDLKHNPNNGLSLTKECVENAQLLRTCMSISPLIWLTSFVSAVSTISLRKTTSGSASARWVSPMPVLRSGCGILCKLKNCAGQSVCGRHWLSSLTSSTAIWTNVCSATKTTQAQYSNTRVVVRVVILASRVKSTVQATRSTTWPIVITEELSSTNCNHNNRQYASHRALGRKSCIKSCRANLRSAHKACEEQLCVDGPNQSDL